MNWRKLLFVVMLIGMTVLGMVGCGKANESTPAEEQTTPAIEQPAPAEQERPTPTPEGTRPVPTEGGISGNMPGNRPSVPAMDLATAAAKLGVTEKQLREALGDMSKGPLDLAAAAQKLGVSENSLREALGFPGGGFPPGGTPPVGPGSTGQGK